MGQDWIDREIIIDASPERVWDVLTEAGHLTGWFGDSAEIDLRPGGTATFGWAEHGIFLAVIERVEPPAEMSFRWARAAGTEPGDGTSTLVEFTVTEIPVGTLLRVVESGFASLHVSPDARAAAAERSSKGWTDELAELKDYAERPES
jgi:uncharacterized protein YndB with AHSA1/START domain